MTPRPYLFSFLPLLVTLAAACGGSSSQASSPSGDAGLPGLDGGAPPQDGGASGDASAPSDAGADVDKAATCASSFGNGLTNAFGRMDGTVVAVVPPGDEACAMPNSTHLVVQVQAAGAVYRMVVDVLSTLGSPDVLIDEIDTPLAPLGMAWAEGWHPGAALDYVTTLNVHSGAFTPVHQADLVARITREIDLGARISIFATSQDSPSSAHLVHRNATNADGAIVIRPDSGAPHYILLRFGEQTF
jgi:hypothetical protein